MAKRATPKVSHGRTQVDESYAEAFRTLFSHVAARHAFDLLAQRDPLAGAVTRDRATNLWRAWQSARREIANGNPLDGWKALKVSASRAPLDPDAATLADAERLALISESLANSHQVLPALEQTLMAQAVLRRFVARLKTNRTGCASELRKMLSVLAGVNVRAKTEDDGIVGAWVVTRGIDLLRELAQRRAELNLKTRGDIAAVATDLEEDARHLERCADITFDVRAAAGVSFALGNVLTDTDPRRAFEHFDAVARTLGVEDGLGLQAAINAAHCLMRAGELAEAEARLASLESLYEYRGDMQAAARVWISECIANWKRLRDPAVRRPLVAAIGMFEETVRNVGDPLMRFIPKRFVEPGYLLLVAAIAHSNDRSDDALDQLLSATWALMSRDLLADLEHAPENDPWEAMLARERRPLAATRTMLAPFPGLGIVHVLSATDCLVWVVYGYDETGRFRFASHAGAEAHAGRLVDFIRTMHQQLEADRLGDALATATYEDFLRRLGEQIAVDLPEAWHATLASMRRLVYMPHPHGSVDEFPLGGLRIGGAWLAESVQIVRSPSINHLREALAPNRAETRPNGSAVVVLGAPEATGEALKGARVESGRARHMLEALGFDARVHDSAGRPEMGRWLEGEVGALHYVGHGIANQVYEGLPLPSGEDFGPVDADRLDGHRVPFLFLCACMAARVRAGAGGYQTGVASKLLERGAPAVVAFTMPVIEARAYALAEYFYRASSRLPFGAAVCETMRTASPAVPAYARLAFAAYGDPSFALTEMAGAARVPGLPQEAATWHSRLRNHCVLRSAATESELRAALSGAPAALRQLLGAWLDASFKTPPAASDALLNGLEAAALAAPDCAGAERLSVRAAALTERLHSSGVETVPIYIKTDAASIKKLLDMAYFLATLGGALFDMHLNGLGNSLIGRVMTVNQNDARGSALFLRQGREKLLECEDRSAFVATLRATDAQILQHYGLPL
jgi:hypothetical protein